MDVYVGERVSVYLMPSSQGALSLTHGCSSSSRCSGACFSCRVPGFPCPAHARLLDVACFRRRPGRPVPRLLRWRSERSPRLPPLTLPRGGPPPPCSHARVPPGCLTPSTPPTMGKRVAQDSVSLKTGLEGRSRERGPGCDLCALPPVPTPPAPAPTAPYQPDTSCSSGAPPAGDWPCPPPPLDFVCLRLRGPWSPCVGQCG